MVQARIAPEAAPALVPLFETVSALHHHLCPKQVLGVRMGCYAGDVLGLPVPQAWGDKRLLTIVETDGCAADGIAVATNCWVGRRTMRIEDYGKVAATFVDSATGRSVRLAPRPDLRERVGAFAPDAADRWEAYLLGYQRMLAEVMFTVQPVRLTTPIEKIVSRPGCRVPCEGCGEEIINEREVLSDGRTLCRACAGGAYYRGA